jgi:hypothetical protein
MTDAPLDKPVLKYETRTGRHNDSSPSVIGKLGGLLPLFRNLRGMQATTLSVAERYFYEHSSSRLDHRVALHSLLTWIYTEPMDTQKFP